MINVCKELLSNFAGWFFRYLFDIISYIFNIDLLHKVFLYLQAIKF